MNPIGMDHKTRLYRLTFDHDPTFSKKRRVITQDLSIKKNNGKPRQTNLSMFMGKSTGVVRTKSRSNITDSKDCGSKKYVPDYDVITGNLENNGDTWELLCVTQSDWIGYLDILKKSKRKQDRELLSKFTDDLLENIFKIIKVYILKFE
ncbi:hypothetical protein AYI70_g6843 [Smittium culicis]|uniref:Uncharacterized protein n=1 Tax=Smittium culicis TaxID=133412 RepID=A0A1R1XN60_9FUNG|nr:hypothetical protein AYI70_g6843 [Smittium culicis]